MNPLGTDVTSRRSLLNGLVTAATRSWRHGLQSNGHNSNALVFPTISTSVNNSQTFRTPTTDNANITEEQRRWQQQQQEHRLNLLWYGGDEMQRPQQSPAVLFELHNRNQSSDDWEKQPLRQRRRKSQQSQHQQIHKKRSASPTSPILWAVLLHTMYSAAMAALYYIYGLTSGSGWIWLREVDSSSSFRWLCQLPPMWYFVGQAFCAVTIGYIWYQWQKRQRWCCYMLIALFISAILPSVPLAEVFGDKSVNTTEVFMENSAERRNQLLQQFNYYNSEGFYENQLALYEGLWHMSFFIFVSYCLVWPTSVDGQSANEDSTTINEHNDNQKNIEDNYKEDHHISTAVLLFAVVASIGHTILNMYIAYQQHKRLVKNSSMAAIQQLIANVVVLACVNLAGWLLRQSIIQDRQEIRGHKGNNRFDGKLKCLRLALRRQADKLNQLLTSLLPRRVFLEMKHDIVADAARSLNAIRSSNDNNHRDNAELQSHQQKILLKTNNMPRMYLKEYENVSIVFANVTGFWDNAPLIEGHYNSGSQTGSIQLITLIDRLLGNLFRKLAYRNHCLPIRLLGHRMYFIAGLPDEESYGYNDNEQNNGSWMMNDNGHARNAIQMGLDLIDAVNTVVRDISRCHGGHKINLNVRVGVHSGRVACGVLGFTGGTGIRSDSGSRWQYSAWGHDVHVASFIENSGRPGLVHVSRATVNQVTKKGVANTAVNRVNHLPPGVNLHNNTINYQTDSRNNLDDYSFERSHEEERNQFLRHNRIDTYFVIPRTVYSHSENNETLTDNYQIHDNGSGDIVSLILQSVDQQLLREEMRQRCAITKLRPETEMESELPTMSTTAVADMPVTMAALIPVAPVASVMKRNRHRRSRYFEQESQQAVSTNLNTNSAITSSMKRYGRWEYDVFVVCNNDDHEKVRDKSDDDDLFRIAKSQLLLLCIIIALFVVNVTTMPWTMLLGITFITPFILTAGELIYVMALLIDWIPRPRFFSTTYATAIIADDDVYYHHYDSDDNDSETSSSSNCGKCLRRFFVCHPGRYSLFAWLLKPFQCRTNTAMATRNHVASGDDWGKCSLKRCRDYGRHSWFTCYLNNEGASSCMSSDDSDIESRLGFRNENAIMAATARTSPSQQQNRLQYSQPININTIYNKNLSRRRHRQLKRIFQDEEKRTYFYWTCACCELIVVLLICLLALLNAFTCEPVEITATNSVYNQLHTHNTINGSGGFNTPTVNTTQHRSPLTCMWPQYAVLTCCLVYVSIAIAFPIYYGSLPTLRMKIGILFVMTCVFAVAFVHFTHKHVFIAASMSSPIPPFFRKSDEFQNHRTNNTVILNNKDHHEINTPIHSDGYRENQRLLTLQDREQQRVAGLNTATATVYAIAFAMATLACFVYKHRLQYRRALYRVKVDRDVRRLDVLREAHRRTLHAIVPEHVANLLRRSFSNNVNDANNECEETQQQQNYVYVETRPIPIRTTHQIQEHMPAYLSPPLYQCGYRAIVIMFATIVQEQSLPTTINNGENNDSIGHHCHKQLALLHNIFSEFDRLLDNQKYRGLIEKIKMLGTNTYMAAVGLQHNDGPKRRQVMLLEDMKERCDDSSNGQEQNNVNNYHVNDLENEYELYNVISGNYITFALDFIRDMRRVLHCQQAMTLTSVGSSNNSHPTQFVLRVGVNIGPAVAGLIGCNDRIWKRPQFDVWGDTVNIARQMDITSIPGRTQVATDVVDILKSMQHQKYQFDVHTKIISKDDRIFTYFIRESFERDNEHNLIHQKPSNYHQSQPRQISPYRYESNRSHQQNKQQTSVRPSQNIHRSTPLHLTHVLPPLNAVPLVNIHSKHSHYNSIVQKDLRQKCLEPQKTPPPPPPPRSPPPVTTRRTQYPVQHKYNEERDQYLDIQNRSRGAHSSHGTQEQYQINRCTSNLTASTAATYARPLQKQQQQSTLVPVPPGLVRIFGDSQQLSPPNTQTTTEAKLICSSSNHSTDGTNLNTTLHNKQLQQVRRPNVLLLKNTTSASTNKFDANRPLPDPPRSSDTVAGRHQNRDDPRRRRRRQHNQPPTLTKQQQEAKQDINHDRCPGAVSPAWPSSSSFRSPISVGSFVSASSPPSSLSSSGSTDAGGTTTSNNNYNTTTTASSSDDSYGCAATEDGAGIDRMNTEDLDTAVSSVAISIRQRYRQQQHLLLHQWSPSTTANSSPVRRSSSFRSPLSAGDNTAASSSSLRSPPIVDHTTTTNFGGTQSLNRRHVRPDNTTTGADSSSSRRRRRRQQQQNSAPTAGNSTPPAGVIPDVIGIMNNTSNGSTEKYESSSSPWKKHQQQQQRRQVTSKDQATGGGVVGPDFTDEIRRILLLDHHRGNVRQQSGGPFKDELQANKHCDDYTDNKDKINDNIDKHLSSSEKQHICIATVATTDRKPDKDDKKNQRIEKDIVNTAAISVPTTNVSSASLFEERERQITEQVKRQQAEVRRILQEHKNNVVAVVKGPATVTADTISHSRKRVMAVAVESSWSDDESLEPLSSLLDNKHRPQGIGFSVDISDQEANGSIVIAETEYTTGGDGDDYTTDGDGYTTTGYTTDEAAASVGQETDMPYASTGDLPDASTARQLDDNLSTMNDTGLTDAEAALSDVNSMIDYNDCNDNNRYRGRRQSSLSSNSVCPYASDSFCEDDDDYNDDGQYFFWDGYHVQNENIELGDDDDNDSRYNQNHILLQQQLSLTHSSSSSPPPPPPPRAVGCTGIDKKRSHYPQQLQPSTTLQAGDSDTTINITQRPIMPDATIAVTTTRLAQIPTSIASNTNINASPNCCSTTTNTFSTNTELDEPPPSSNIIKDMS